MPAPQAAGATHSDSGWRCPPESLTIETARTSAFYDEGVETPLPEEFIENIRVRGVIEPVCVVRDGDRFIVNNGRKRTRALLEANRRRVKAGLAPLTIGYFIKRTTGEADILGISAAANLHVEDSPMHRARKALRMSEAGASVDQIANDFGVSGQCVKNWLALLDCATVVQKAVDAGEVPETVARKLAELPREAQSKALDEMKAKGATRGAPARKAVRAAKQGRAIAPAPRTRARPAPLVERIVAQLTDRDRDLKADGAAWLACLRWRAGEEVDVPDDVAEVLDEMKGTKAGAGAPKGETKAPRAAKGKAA